MRRKRNMIYFYFLDNSSLQFSEGLFYYILFKTS